MHLWPVSILKLAVPQRRNSYASMTVADFVSYSLKQGYIFGLC